MGTAGIRRLLDVILPEQQLLAEDHVGAWDPATGLFVPGFPARMNDLQFFVTPAIADVTGDGIAEVLQGSAMYDLRAYGPLGLAAPGWPRFTGGWTVTTPAVGDLDGDGLADVASPTREGNLFVWRTPADACAATIEWPKYQHDLRNTGTHGADGRAPGVVGPVVAASSGSSVALSWTAARDDGRCGAPVGSYELVDARGAVVAASSSPGATVACALGVVEVRAVDDAGQRGFPSPVATGCPGAVAAVLDAQPAAAPMPVAIESLPATGRSAPVVPWVLAVAVLVLAVVRRSRIAR